MRKTLVLVTMMTLAAMPLAAQQRGDSTLDRRSLPRDIAREAESRWNGGAFERKATGSTDVAAGDTVRGLAVRDGHLTIAGVVSGHVLAINTDVVLRPTARIEGDLWVVGGQVDGRHAAAIDGEVRIYRDRMAYRDEGERMIALRDSGDADRWWRRWEARRSTFDLSVAQAGPYNRVEGLPVRIGPVLEERHAWGSWKLAATGIVRTGSTFESDGGDVGHDVSTSLRAGRRAGVSVGGRLFNVVEPVEDWQLTDLEASLASFLFHRDYRDHHGRHGVSGVVTIHGGLNTSLAASLSDERWASRSLRDPFTLFRNEVEWRPNPAFDEGRMHIGHLTLQHDTRSDPDDPWAGWFIVADVERGRGTLTSVAPTGRPRDAVAGEALAYTRGLLDVRRYNRLSPGAQLNMRLVAGGWLGGDALPLQRRVSAEGPGALPGFDFRAPRPGTIDVGTCSTPGSVAPGLPTLCERVAVVQVEYRGDLHFDFGGNWRGGHWGGVQSDAVWVLFADAGRGWLVGTPTVEDGLTYERGRLPPLSTFRSDIGAGIDFGAVGVYLAKAVSHSDEGLNVFVRLHRRF